MSKGAIPVPYIVALVIAIVLIAVLAYMFFTNTGLFSGSAQRSQCEAKAVQLCYSWKRIEPSFASASYPWSTGQNWNTYALGCADMGIAEPGRSFCINSTIG